MFFILKYLLSNPDLVYPFSFLFYERVEGIHMFFSEEYRRQCLEKANLDEYEELTSTARKSLVRRVSRKVEQVITEMTDSECLVRRVQDYVDDVLDIKSEEFSQTLSRHKRVAILKAHFVDDFPVIDPEGARDVLFWITQLHSVFWMDAADDSFTPLLYFVQECMSNDVISIDIEEQVKKFCDVKQKATKVKEMRKGNLKEPGEQDDSLNDFVESEQYDPAFATGTAVENGKQKWAWTRERNEVEEDLVVEDIEDLSQTGNYEQAQDNHSIEDADEAEEEQHFCEKPEPTFKEVLVQEICGSLFPTDTVVESVGGIEAWKNVTSFVLSTTVKYGIPFPAFHFLKVCYDFASLVLPNSKPFSLFVLGELGSQVGDRELPRFYKNFYKYLGTNPKPQRRRQ